MAAIEPDKIYNNQYFSRTGYIDSTIPTERQVKRDFVGVFFTGLYTRADMASEFLQKLFVERVTGQQEFEEVEWMHPWAVLLRTPNREYSAYYIWQWTILNIDLQGHADFVAEYDGRGVLTQLHPMFKEFGQAEPLPSQTGGIMGWRFMRSDGFTKNYERGAVIRLGRRNPLNPYKTLSLIEASRAELEEDAIMKEYRQKSAGEGGWNNNLLSTDKDLSPSQHQELTKEYKKFRGAKGANNVGILSSGMKPIQLMNAKDLEYIQGRAQTLDVIREILGTKGLGEPATTRASAEAVRFDIIQGTIAPLVRLVCSELTTSFNYAFGAEPGNIVVRPPEMIPLDPEFELRKRRVYLETGQRTINDYLAEDGFPDVTEGNKRYLPMGLREITAEAPETERSEKRSEDIRGQIWRRIDDKKKNEARITYSGVQAWFDSIERKILKELRDKEVRTIDEVFGVPFDIGEAIEDWVNALTPEAGRIIQDAWQEVMNMAGIDGLEFSLFSPTAREALETAIANQSSVPLTLHETISDLIQDGIKKGDSNRQIMQSVRQYFDESAPGKIQNIVNGFSTTAWEAGQHVAYQQAGIDEQEWLSSRDERVRETHFEADGQRVGVNERFQVGTARLRYPGDPESSDLKEVIGCRCSTLGRISERKLQAYAKRYCKS